MAGTPAALRAPFPARRAARPAARLVALALFAALSAAPPLIARQEAAPDLERIERWLASGDPDRRAAAERELDERIGLDGLAALGAYLARPLADAARGPLRARFTELVRTRVREVEEAIEGFETARRLAQELGEELGDTPEPASSEELDDLRRNRRQGRVRVEEGMSELRALGLALAPILFHRLAEGGAISPLVARFHDRLWEELEVEARRLHPHAPGEGAIGPEEARALVPLLGSLEENDPEGWARRRREVAAEALARIETLEPAQVDEGRALLLELGDAAAEPLAAWVEEDGPLPRDLRERVAEWQRLRLPPGFERRTALDLGSYGSLPRARRQELIHRLEFVGRGDSAAVLHGIVVAEDDVALKVEAAAVLSRLGDPRGAGFLRELGLEQAVELEAISRRVLLIEALQRRESGDEAGALDDLLAILRRFPGDFRLHYEIGYSALRLRRLELSIEHFERALALEPRDPIARYNYACALALAGRADPALDALERAAEEGFRDAEHIREDPDLESLRDLPRFRELLERLAE